MVEHGTKPTIIELGVNMKISYNKLWKLLIDKKMKIMDLQKATNPNISSATLAKMKNSDRETIVKNGKEKSTAISTDIVLRICKALDCDIAEIMEIVK